MVLGTALGGRGGEGWLSEDFAALGALAPGSRVAGYLVDEPLGAGGMAMVYRARDERLGRPVALKVLAPALAADEQFRRRFTAESRAAAAVDHPHIIPVYEAGQAGRALFIAMRLVTGGDLRRVLAREGPLPPERAAQFLSPVASALDAAHRAGLVHRDVKPANILVDADPERPDHVYLSDFGISKGISSATGGLTGTGQYLGTPEYTSPEQVNGQAVNGRADQYALACVAWHLLTGTVLFHRDQGLAVLLAHLNQSPPLLAERRPDLPAAAGQVLARALAKDPAERYLSCGEFAGALREALALPSYRSAAPAPAATAPANPADAPATGEVHPPAAARAPGIPARSASGPDGPDGPGRPDRLAPDTGTPEAAADKATQDIAAPGQRIGSGPGLDSSPARPARRRRYLPITLAGALLAAAAVAIPVLLSGPDTPRPPSVPHASTPAAASAASRNKTQPATQSRALTGTPTASPAASSQQTKPATLSGPLTGTLTATLSDRGGKGVYAVAFAPGGTTLATGDTNGSIYLWDTATGKLTATLTDPASEGVPALAFAPGGTTLATGDTNGSTYLWDTATGKITATLTYPGSQDVKAAAFGPGGITLAAGDYNGSIYLWDTATGTLTATLTDPGGESVYAVAFAPGGITLATGDQDGSTYLWDTATRKITATLTDPGGQGVDAVAFVPGSTTLAAGDLDGSTYLWRISRRSS